jgi:hypothetical protein
MPKTFKDRFQVDFYSFFIWGLILLLLGAKLYTNAYLCGMPLSTMSNLVEVQTVDYTHESLNSARLPGIYVFHLLYKYLGLSDESFKICMVLFVLAVEVVTIYQIALLAFESKTSAILAVLILLFSSLFYSVGAPKPFVENNLAALSIVLVVLATLLWLKENYVLSALIVGFSFDCHPIYPLAFILTFFSYLIIRYRTISARTVISALALFLLVTLPVTLSVVKSALFVVKGLAVENLDPELIWRYIRVAQPEHAFFDIKPEFHIGFSIYIASFLLLSLFFLQGERAKQGIFLKLFLLTLVTISFHLFDNLNSYYFKIIPLFNLKLARFTSYGSVMVYVTLAGAVTCTLNHTGVNRILQTLLFLLLCFSILNPFLGPYASLWITHLLILEVVIIYYLYNLFHIRGRLSSKLLTLNLVLLAISLIYFYYLVLFNQKTHNIAFVDFFTLKKVEAFFKTFFQVHFELKVNENVNLVKNGVSEAFYILLIKVTTLFMFSLIGFKQVSSFKSFAAVPFASFFRNLYDRFLYEKGRGIVFNVILIALSAIGLYREYSLGDFKETPYYQYEKPMKEWVINNTSREDRFLIPLSINSWSDTNRYAFYDVNIINNASYNKVFIMEAIKRLQILVDLDLKNMTEKEMSEISPLNGDWTKRHTVFNARYNNLSEERLLKFRDDYDIDYFVTTSDTQYTFPIVFKNKGFRIYRLSRNDSTNDKKS